LIAVFGLIGPSAQTFAADKLRLSSSNPTALEMDQIVAREKGFFARENIDLDLTKPVD
jgi:ABC-type nitrate/sulfonate/bicarbonate transport system substrate-binding protein